MSYPLLELVANVLLPLMIPAAIIAARRRQGGAIIACAAVALICFGMLGFVAVSNYSGIVREGDPWPVPPVILYSGGTFAGWTLALYDAVRTQRRQWVAGLTLASLASWATLAFASDPCLVSALFSPNQECSPPPLALIASGFVVALDGPAVSLAYGLRVHRHGQRESISPPGGQDAVLAGEQAEDADAELEIRAERL